jgi:hypothetical protein
LTYGLPGFAVDVTGALHLSLMRSCTGWPSGVWIDPPRRTLPDGASFQLQHWTHEFAYALVSGPGDWRAQTLPAQGQEFNHPLYARTTTPHTGTLPATRSYLRVRPAREVLLSALKPAGNAIAHGGVPGADPAAGVTVRLIESTGHGRNATLRGALALTDLHRADLLERPGEPVPPIVGLTGAEVATLHAVPAARPAGGPPLGPQAEFAQPVFARYWLHNRGPAPMGYLPVTVALSPGLMRTGGEPVTLSVVIASQLTDTPVEGDVTLIAPDGWTAGPARRPYRLEAGGHLRFPVTVTPPADAAPGLHFVAAQIEHGGQTIEDVVSLVVGDLPEVLPVPGDVPEDWTAAQGTAADAGRPTGLTVDVAEPVLTVTPGGRATFGVELGNQTRSEVRGEVQVVSPWGTWDLIAEPIRGFALAAGAAETLTFEVGAPADTQPGSYWAIAKVMWFGRCQYTPTVPVVVTP